MLLSLAALSGGANLTPSRAAPCAAARAAKGGRFKLSTIDAAEARARAEEFTKVSEMGTWGAPMGERDGDADTVSGGGSFIHTTATARTCITAWMKKYKIESVLDAPCGDALWQGLVDGFDKGRYTGADISGPALARAMARRRNQDANMRFRWMDVTTEVIDGCLFDAVMCAGGGRGGGAGGGTVFLRRSSLLTLSTHIADRDFIQHLSLANGVRALQNARDGGVAFLIASTFPATTTNIAQDQLQPSHKNNLRLAPYFLPEPLEDCDNHIGEDDGSRLQLFRLS